MTPCVLWIPVYQYTSIRVYQSLPSPTLPWYWWQRLRCRRPSSRWDRASRRHVDHFCSSLPGVTPGPQDHSYPHVWCNTRPLGPLTARVWCNTRPPGPLQPPSGELVIPATPSWEFPGIVPLHSWTFLLESYQDSRTTSRSPPWNSCRPSTPCLVRTRPLGFLTSRLQVRGRNCTTQYLKCSSVRFEKTETAVYLLCFFQRTVNFPSV